MNNDINKWFTVLGTGLLISMTVSQLEAKDNPFSTSVFRSVQYQIADLDEEGCGGAMTEYRVTREEQPVEQNSQAANDSEVDKAGEEEKEKDSFWSRLCRQLCLLADE